MLSPDTFLEPCPGHQEQKTPLEVRERGNREILNLSALSHRKQNTLGGGGCPDYSQQARAHWRFPQERLIGEQRFSGKKSRMYL